jgi:Flp pilus assembly protein TadD
MALTGIDEPVVDEGVSSVDKNENQTDHVEVEASAEHANSTEKSSLTNQKSSQSVNEAEQDHPASPVQSTESSVTVGSTAKFDASATVDIPFIYDDSVTTGTPSASHTNIPASTATNSQTKIPAALASTSQSKIPASTAPTSHTDLPASVPQTSESVSTTETDTSAGSTVEVATTSQAEPQGIANSTTQDTDGSSASKPDPIKSALVSKVLKKAREAAESDQRSTGSTAYPGDQRSTGATRLPDQRTTGSTSSTRLPDQRSTGSTPRQDQKSTGATRLADQSTTGATRFNDQRSTGSTRFTDQKSTGSTRFNDQKNTGATPRISDQRSTGSTPAYSDYNDMSTTGTFKSLIGRPPLDGSTKTGEQSDAESDENAPERSRESLAATIETEAQKKCKTSTLEKVVTKHPILLGSAAFLIFVVPVYLLIVNSQSPSERAEYKSSFGKDVKIMASKLGKPGEYKGHKVAFYANRADAYIKSAEYQSAISDLKIARQIDPVNDADYNLKLSTCYLAIKDYKNASQTAADALKDDSTNVDALLLHAKSSYLFGNKLTALDDYFKAAKLDPSNPKVLMERGDYYVAEKKTGSAAADYKHALELAPGLAEAKQKLAACTAMVPTHQSSSGSAAADAANKLSPAAMKVIAESDFATLRTKGYEALEKGDNLFAIAALSRAVALNPNGAIVRQYLAHALIANDDFEGAANQFNAWDKIATLKLPEKLAFIKRFPTGNNKSAGDLYTQLIEQNSANGDALVSIANACRAQGYQEQFEAALSAGLKIGTPAQVAQLTTMKVVNKEEVKAINAKAVIAN